LGILIEESDKGPRIDQVMPGSGAEKAGLQVNDVIQSVNGKVMKRRDKLIDTVKGYLPGAKIRLSVIRGEEILSITATLGDRSRVDPGSKRQNFQNALGGALSRRRAGFPLALQHDSVLRPRDCGGPIVDLDGKAIGINIARAGRVSSYALPVSVIKPLLPDFLAGRFSPEAAAKEKVKKLSARILDLKTSQQELGKKVATFEQAIKKAKTAEDKAKKAFEQAQAVFKKAQTEVANAEKNAGAARIELTVAQSELKSVEAEKTELQKKDDEDKQ
jgi:serine protease Do